MIVLLEKQVHLQNDVGSVRDSSHEFLECEGDLDCTYLLLGQLRRKGTLGKRIIAHCCFVIS